MDYEADDSKIFFDEVKNDMEYETVDILTPFKRIQVWSNSETKQLMDLYKRFISEVGTEKRFAIKKEMWVEISTYFPNKDAKQCEQRYNTVLKRKKNCLTKVYISEARRKTIECAQNTYQINRIQKKDKRRYKIIPLINTEKKNLPVNNSVRKIHTIPEILLEIAAKKEEAKERRHQEKMEVIKQIQHLLQQILDSKNK